MGGLNTSLLIGLQALEASQGALTAASNNIANANTPGYTREVVHLSEQPQAQVGNEVIGGGVTLAGLQSVRDELLELQIQQQTSSQSSADTQYSILQQVENYFTTTGTDITSAFSGFSSSLVQLSSNPTDSVLQQGVLNSGRNLARAFNTTANGLTKAQSTADSQVTQTVAQINTITGKIAQLNGQLAQLKAAGKDGGTVQDQRDQLVEQLSALTGISITQSSDGDTITTGNGIPLVMGSKSISLQTTTGPDGMQRVLDANGNDVTASLQGGQLGGAIQIRDKSVPEFMADLNALAAQFSAAFNAAQVQGVDSKGNAGQNFFSIPASGAAAGIKVAINDSSLIAIGSASGNGNVANLTAALTNALPSGQAPAQAYASLVAKVGSAGSDASTQSSAIGQNLLRLTNQRGSVSGVNIDEETTNLIRFQTAYQAAARIVNTIQKLSADTINMIS